MISILANFAGILYVLEEIYSNVSNKHSNTQLCTLVSELTTFAASIIMMVGFCKQNYKLLLTWIIVAAIHFVIELFFLINPIRTALDQISLVCISLWCYKLSKASQSSQSRKEYNETKPATV
ncbi:uncharacterized protein LOC108602733 [Drosophila busckii]|uniref:uncharacterized protein LOC108602733 n=1 Tax=Drosophila busckii TaxID=30019 RepID=UPI00083ED365|nr:uncharacterized protein LOC108602733 [Drosophila busckii]